MKRSGENWVCPKCGLGDGYTVNRKATGYWVTSYFPNESNYGGHVIPADTETSADNIGMGPEPKTAKCMACDAKIPNPNLQICRTS